jgi:hypothetical protein
MLVTNYTCTIVDHAISDLSVATNLLPFSRIWKLISADLP